MGTHAEGSVYQEEITAGGQRKARQVVGSLREPARDVPILEDVDVLVVGGGPSGTTAAIAAARSGARTLIVERYNHLGGLSTGGLVIWIDRMTDWDGNLVIAGLGNELLERLPDDALLGPDKVDWGSRDAAHVARWKPRFSAFHDIVTWAPMIDPEMLKAVSLATVREAGAEVLFHAWASSAVVADRRLRGVVFESKQGRFAVTAKVVVDTTGDGDIFASAGERSSADVDPASIHQCMNTAWLWGGVDNERWLSFRSSDDYEPFTAMMRRDLGQLEWPIATWRNDVAVFMGPRWAGYDALDVRDLTEVELRSHDMMMMLLKWYRQNAPGFQHAWIMLTAPQIGVRQSRRLVGKATLTREDWRQGVVHADEIGVSPSLAPQFQSVSVPFGSLLPPSTPNLVVAGRHLSTDASSHTFMREIPQCWLTGHAAGVAAALAADGDGDVVSIQTERLRRTLIDQGAFIRDAALATVAA